MPDQLRRSDFLKLTGHTRERFDALARRDQLPLSADRMSGADGYSWFEAFLQIAADDLCDPPKQEARSAAKATICAIGPALASRWQDIARSADDPSLPEIVWVRLIHTPDEEARFTNIVGTQAEVGAAIAAAPACRKIDGGSATTCAALLLRRAAKQAIEVPDEFWTATPKFAVELADADISAAWSRAVDEAVKRKGK